MKSAVILAAGMGTRLRDVHAGAPKGLLELDGRALVEWSLLRLERAGVSNVIIVTGYGAEHYGPLAARFDGLVQLVHNPEFAESGSMYSLYCARELIDDDFLLLESDLLYEQRALDVLISADSSDAVLLSGPTGAGDEVYVATHEGLLRAMSKDRDALGAGVAGELVGISRVSRGLFGLMKHLAAAAFQQSLRYDYETDCLVAAARTWDIPCPLVPDLIWGEIDDPAHLERAREVLLPKLRGA